jgi:hypothetical protein
MINFLTFIFVAMALMNLVVTPFSVYCAYGKNVNYFFKAYLFNMSLTFISVLLISPFIVTIEILKIINLIPVGVF